MYSSFDVDLVLYSLKQIIQFSGVLGLPRETEPIYIYIYNIYIYTYAFMIYFKKVAHLIEGTVKSKFCRASLSAVNIGRR